ncbi:MAG: ATP-binding protein [Deltaproteobacteria bacterium]|nr:ATP-binding protein [Deltaproteobacteria bacterium]
MTLKPWREVAEPHADVASGRYAQAEFAADLAQVASGKAEAEYQDAAEFFRRTYVTDGMARLLENAAMRMLAKGGEPVVQLKTAFGGGKTHTMLALYHLFKGGHDHDALKDVPYVKQVLDELHAKQLPKTEVAVIVGTALDPSKPRKPKGLRNIEVRTLWGELAVQLAGRDGYKIVEKADEKSVAPGKDTLCELFELSGPCIILVDELLAYMRNIYKAEDLPSGTFDSNLTFVQSLTEAARSTPQCMLVASIPESNIEIGGEAGKAALKRIEHTFGRMEAIWTPVGALEGFEIVRRRLFKPIKDEKARDATCAAFRDYYDSLPAEFPAEVRKPEFHQRLTSAYPIHPEIFDRLYEEWGTLERFQKTRGVLRLMACAIHQLWKQGDNAPMILPGSIPLDTTRVRDELAQYLPDGWKNVIEADVDGERSEPMRVDQDNPRFGKVVAARRVARAVFLGSAPSVKTQTVRGIEEVRIRLGVAQPDDNVAVFKDALSALMQRCTHLYSGNSRYWYDMPANLRRTVEDRAVRFDPEQVQEEIVARLRKCKERGLFRGAHVASQSADVPDEQEARLVVLPITASHAPKADNSKAELLARAILDKRGDSPRRWRNMLIFVAADDGLVEDLDREVRQWLAWRSVVKEADALNLDRHQQKQADDALKQCNDVVQHKLTDAYLWLLVPTQEGAGKLSFTVSRLSGGEDPVDRAAKKAKAEEHLIAQWSPALLRMELDRWLWKDQPYISVEKLWEHLCTYCYLPRLVTVDVLRQAMRDGVRSKDYFGYATSIAKDGKYQGLVFGADPGSIHIDSQAVLIKPESVQQQLEAEAKQLAAEENSPIVVAKNLSKTKAGTIKAFADAPQSKPAEKPHRFFATVRLDPLRFSRDVDQIGQEVIQHLTSLDDSEVELHIEIEARSPKGFAENVVRTVGENCNTLKFDQFAFEGE